MLSMDRWTHYTVSTTTVFQMTVFISSCQCYVVTVIISITFVTFIVTSRCIVWFTRITFISSSQCYVVTVIIVITFLIVIVTSWYIAWFTRYCIYLKLLMLCCYLSHYYIITLLFLLSHYSALFGSLGLHSCQAHNLRAANIKDIASQKQNVKKQTAVIGQKLTANLSAHLIHSGRLMLSYTRPH